MRSLNLTVLTLHNQAHALSRAQLDSGQDSYGEGLRLASYVAGPSDDFSKQCSPESLNFTHSKSGSFDKPEYVETHEVDVLYRLRWNKKQAAEATKSEILIRALGDIGREYETPVDVSRRKNFSFTNAIDAASDKNTTKNGSRYPGRRFSQSLPVLLALYIEHTCSNIRNQVQFLEFETLSHILPEQKLKFLQSKGYDLEDLLTWSWIITAKTADQAAMRLTAYSNKVRHDINGGKQVPTFLFTFLLRRQHFSSRGIRLMIGHGWDRLLHQHKSHARDKQIIEDLAKNGLYPRMTEHCLTMMVIRLLRRARETWPVGLISITSMITNHLNGDDTSRSGPKRGLSDNAIARITHIYNSILSLLAEPMRLRPFQSVTYQQQAQFLIIRKMYEFQPSLTIDRHGYQAMVRVQLAHQKIPKERRWAEMKAKSWPPWKKEKSGLDIKIVREKGRSRAGEVMMQSREAGYAPQGWDKVAAVFSGWDTDQSPTIQTRTQLYRPATSRSSFSSNKDASDIECDATLWAARIMCTRTLDEAWACFLSAREMGMQPSEKMYFSLFEKVIFHEKMSEVEKADNGNAQSIDDDAAQKPLPGDGKETWPIPGPTEAIYTRKPAPNRDDLYEMMIDDKMRLSGRFLNHLLRHARSFTEGARYLHLSTLSPKTIEGLLNEDTSKDQQFSSIIAYVDSHIFASFISFLVKSAANSTNYNERTFYMTSPPRIWSNPLRQAFRLMDIRKPPNLPPWYSLVQAMLYSSIIIDPMSHRLDQNSQRVMKWGVISSLLDKMEEIELQIDPKGFMLACNGLEKALVAISRLPLIANHATYSINVEDYVLSDMESHGHQGLNSFQLQVENASSRGLARLKRYFKRISGWQRIGRDRKSRNQSSGLTHESLVAEADFDPVTLLPRIHEIFHASELHAFVRVLGVGGDHDGILDVLRWMHQHHSELESAVDDTLNGRRLTRRCIVAIGASLERGSFYLDNRNENRGHGRASPEILQEAYNLVEDKSFWGGWPTSDEIEAYCSRFTREQG